MPGAPRRPARPRRAGTTTRRRGLPATAAVIGVLVAVTGCRAVGTPTPLVATPPGSRTVAHGPSSTAATAARTVVAVGDSVPAGTACGGCQTYVDLIGSRIEEATGVPVTVRNDGVPGWTSQDVLTALRRGGAVADDVAGADVLVLTIGANDFDFSDYVADQCADSGGLGCYQDALATLRRTTDLILERVAALRAGRPTTVVVTGYWNVWQDGQVAAAKGSEFVRVARTLTAAVNDVLQASATAAGAAYVDLVPAFRGADDVDDSPLLAADGDHPNAAGHAAIAAAVLGAVPSLLQ